MQTFLLMVGAEQQNSEIWDVLFSLIAGKTMLSLERRRTVALSTSSRQCTTDLATAIRFQGRPAYHMFREEDLLKSKAWPPDVASPILSLAVGCVHATQEARPCLKSCIDRLRDTVLSACGA